MNHVSIVGRLVRDVDLRQAGELPVAHFTVAVDRPTRKEGQQSSDFISCVSFGKGAEFVSKYFQKGSRLGLTGRIQTGSYEKDGRKVYTTDVVAEHVEFVESKGSSNNSAASSSKSSDNDWMNIPEGTEEEEGLPFH